MVRFFSIILISLAFISCDQEEGSQTKSIPVVKNGNLVADLYSYTGVDKDGKTRSCIDQFGAICTEVFTDSDQFGLDCENKGDFPVQCNCHDWICVDRDDFEKKEIVSKGYNHKGELESCIKFDESSNEKACTMEFTDSDQFGLDCKNEGFEVIQCGCHSWLCSNPIN